VKAGEGKQPLESNKRFSGKLQGQVTGASLGLRKTVNAELNAELIVVTLEA
jgi:hypothetical protein